MERYKEIFWFLSPQSTIDHSTMSMFCNLQRQLLVIVTITYVRFSVFFFDTKIFHQSHFSHVSSHKLFICRRFNYLCYAMAMGRWDQLLLLFIYRKGEIVFQILPKSPEHDEMTATFFFFGWLLIGCALYVDFYYSTFSKSKVQQTLLRYGNSTNVNYNYL